MLVNKLEAVWKKRIPGGIRPKIQNIPFNGVMGNEIRAMGTKRVPVLANRLFSRNLNHRCLNMSTMDTTATFNRGLDNPEAIMYNPSYDDDINPAYYRDPIDTQYQSRPITTSSKLEKLRLQQELQDLRRERLAEARELQDLRERDLVRKRTADERKMYRAYVLDSSKESRGWLRELKSYNSAWNDTKGMLGM